MGKGCLRICHVVVGLIFFFWVGPLVAWGTSFEEEWRAALARPSGSNDLSGAWEGTWRSKRSSDHDKLRCVITKIAEGDYRARFRAHYWTIFRFGYTVVLRAKPEADGLAFQGAANLGWYAGGQYQYAGRAGATNFFSTYKSKVDEGEFQMRRAAVKPAEVRER